MGTVELAAPLRTLAISFSYQPSSHSVPAPLACPYWRDPVLRSQALQILAMDFNLLRMETTWDLVSNNHHLSSSLTRRSLARRKSRPLLFNSSKQLFSSSSSKFNRVEECLEMATMPATTFQALNMARPTRPSLRPGFLLWIWIPRLTPIMTPLSPWLVLAAMRSWSLYCCQEALTSSTGTR